MTWTYAACLHTNQSRSYLNHLVFIYLFTCLFVYLLIYLFTCLFMYLVIRLFALYIYLFIYILIYVYTHLFPFTTHPLTPRLLIASHPTVQSSQSTKQAHSQSINQSINQSASQSPTAVPQPGATCHLAAAQHRTHPFLISPAQAIWK